MINEFSAKKKQGSRFDAVFHNFKPLSVTTNVVGLQTDDADRVGQNSSAQVALVVGLQTDAVVVTETRLNQTLEFKKDAN